MKVELHIPVLDNRNANREIEDARQAFANAFSSAGLEELQELITEGCLWILRNMPPWVGREEILSRLASHFEEYDYEFDLGPTDLTTRDIWGVDRTSFRSRLTSRSSGEESVHDGHCVIVWKRAERWQIFSYTDTSTTPK